MDASANEPAAAASKVSSAAIAQQEAELARLQQETERRKRVLAECSEYIRELEQRLSLQREECTVLPSNSLSQEVLQAYHEELERLEALKAKSLSKLLREARLRLPPLWEALHFSEAQTHECVAAWKPIVGEGETTSTEGDATEEALFAVEEEERRLQVCAAERREGRKRCHPRPRALRPALRLHAPREIFLSA